jgi:hypothetical protein
MTAPSSPAGSSGSSDSTRQQPALDSAQEANRDEPRNFKPDALEDKVVRVEPDGTGPTSTGSFDAPKDQRQGSGNERASDRNPPAG